MLTKTNREMANNEKITVESYCFLESSDRWIKLEYETGKGASTRFKNVDFVQGEESKQDLIKRETAYALTNYINARFSVSSVLKPNIPEIDDYLWQWFEAVTDYDDIDFAKERYLSMK